MSVPVSLSPYIEQIKQQLLDLVISVDHNKRQVYNGKSPRLWSHYTNVQSRSAPISTLKYNKDPEICKKYRYLYNIDTFFKKEDAYKFSENHSRLPVFSIDKSKDNAKKWYVVCGYDTWWKCYIDTKPEYRYAYEVILPELECHLYVDAEVELSCNSQSLEFYNKLFKELLIELRYFMNRWHIAPRENLDKLDIVFLDSSKPTKFSKHCIIKIPESKFKNNYHCGAFIRQFHAYIIKKYGKSDVNKFYVFSNRKESTAVSTAASTASTAVNQVFKQFIVDLGVYTKGRDFRMLGSFKRASSSKSWLCIDGKPNIILTKQDFFNSLIQYHPPYEPLKYLISNVPDILNGGVPISSSLRTLAPINGGGYSVITANIDSNGIVTTYNLNPSISVTTIQDKRLKISPPDPKLFDALCKYILNKYTIQVVKVCVRNGVIILNTYCKKCLIKRHITKDKTATHTNNVIYFIVNPRDMCLQQSCFNSTYCVEPKSQKHRKFKIEYITDPTLVKICAKWCYDNDWDFKNPTIVTNEWLGDSDDD